ncbi:hypothetical protein F4804DRAFT_336543 [Jackrogersella minutella]|nr:hypothetical protein F4804DRAFT_336543 [Jackrogersella minutella]
MVYFFTFYSLIQLSIWILGKASAGSIAAWTTGTGASQIIMQDDATGNIFYSLCNSNGSTPIFPADESAAFVFESNLAPRNGTSLAGTGWVDTDNANVAAIWFQKEGGQIVYQLWKCNSTGHFNPYDSRSQRVIGVDQSVHSMTGLMALNLGSENGYRVYFQDERKATKALGYNQETNIWRLEGLISRDSIGGFPIGACFLDIDQITVVEARDNDNIEISKQLHNGTWIISTFPTPLGNVQRDPRIQQLLPPTNDTASTDFSLNTTKSVHWSLEAWDGNAGGIGLTINTDSIRSIFYIGNDSLLHSITEANATWWKSTPQDENIWPRADAPNAPFATVYDPFHDKVYIYYVSGGYVFQIYQSSKDQWDAAVQLPKYNTTATADKVSNERLSIGSKAGIGVGVSVVGIALLLLGVCAITKRNKHKEDKKNTEAETETVQTTTTKSPPPQFISYEMPAQEYSHEAPSYHGCQEMPSHEITQELPNNLNHQEGVFSSNHEGGEAKL